MICIERSRNVVGNVFRVTFKEPGMGRGPAPEENLTLEQAKDCVQHYYGDCSDTCIVCARLAEKSLPKKRR